MDEQYEEEYKSPDVKKRSRGGEEKPSVACACGKTFTSRGWYDKHVAKCTEAPPLIPPLFPAVDAELEPFPVAPEQQKKGRVDTTAPGEEVVEANFTCVCGKPFKAKGWYDRHLARCAEVVGTAAAADIAAKPPSEPKFTCVCGKPFVAKGWFDRHAAKCAEAGGTPATPQAKGGDEGGEAEAAEPEHRHEHVEHEHDHGHLHAQARGHAHGLGHLQGHVHGHLHGQHAGQHGHIHGQEHGGHGHGMDGGMGVGVGVGGGAGGIQHPSSAAHAAAVAAAAAAAAVGSAPMGMGAGAGAGAGMAHMLAPESFSHEHWLP